MKYQNMKFSVITGEKNDDKNDKEDLKRQSHLAGLGVTGKALSILETVVSNPKPTPISEIIRETGLTKPTAH